MTLIRSKCVKKVQKGLFSARPEKSVKLQSKRTEHVSFIQAIISVLFSAHFHLRLNYSFTECMDNLYSMKWNWIFMHTIFSPSLPLSFFAMSARKHWGKHPCVVCEVSCQEKRATTPFPKSWPRHYICAVQEHVKPLKHSCFGYSLMEVKWACPQLCPPSCCIYRLLPELCNYGDSTDSL